MGTWNVLSLAHPEYMEALTSALDQYQLKLVSLSETCITGSDETHCGHYTILNSGGTQSQCHWTLLKADIAKLEAFHMMNQRRILGILWYAFVTNVEVATLSELPSINKATSLKRHSLFGYVRRMDQAAPAHQALHLSVTSRQGSGQFGTWRRQPGRPQKCWAEQVTTSTGLSPSVAWSAVTDWSAWRALRSIDRQA